MSRAGNEFSRISGSYSTAYIATWELVSQNISENYSIIKLRSYFNYGGGTSVSSSYSSFTTNGTTTKSGSYTYYPGDTLLSEFNINITHNSDGTFPTTWIGIYANSYHMSGNTGGNISGITTIPRQANMTGATDFNDTDNPTIYFNNFAGDSVSSLQACISLTGSTDDIKYRDVTKTWTSYVFGLTEAERNILRAATPNSNSRTVIFFLKTVIGGNTYYSTLTRTMYIVNANPTFTNFTYADTNSATVTLSGSNQTIIKGYSNVKTTVSTANKAIANKQATMTKYTFKNGSQQLDGAYSRSATVDITLNNATDSTMQVYAIDSRGNSTQKNIVASTFLDYFPINVLTGTTVRGTGGIGTAVTLSFNGAIWNKTFGSVVNSVVSCIYKYKKTTDSTYTAGATVITPTLTGDTYSFNGAIVGDLGATGFDNTCSYNVQVIITDKLTTYTYNIVLQSGIPQMSFGINKGVAVNGFYDTSEGGPLQINGIDINSKNYMIATRDRSSFNFASSWTTYNIGLNRSVIKVGNKLTYSNSGIVIGKGVEYVRASIIIEFNKSNLAGDKILCLLNNNISQISSYDTTNGTYFQTATIPMFILSVKEGDVIGLGFGNGSPGTMEFLNGYLIVEVLK